MKILKSIILATSLPIAALTAQAQVVFTIDAMAAMGDPEVEGYVAGQNYTFVFTLSPTYDGLPVLDDFFASWFENNSIPHSPLENLWIDIGGSAVAGTFSPGTAVVWDRVDLDAGANGFYIYGAGQGLTTLAGTPIVSIDLEGALSGPFPFNVPTSPILAYDYFINYAGETVYNFAYIGSTFTIRYQVGQSIQTIDFTPNTLTVVDAIPEPSTFVLLGCAGACAIGLARRRRNRQLKGLS